MHSLVAAAAVGSIHGHMGMSSNGRIGTTEWSEMSE